MFPVSPSTQLSKIYNKGLVVFRCISMEMLHIVHLNVVQIKGRGGGDGEWAVVFDCD